MDVFMIPRADTGFRIKMTLKRLKAGTDTVLQTKSLADTSYTG